MNGLDTSWFDEFLPTTEGITLKEKRKSGATGPRDINEGKAAKKVRTPGDAAIDLEEQIDDNEKNQLERPNEGHNPGKGDKKRIFAHGARSTE